MNKKLAFGVFLLVMADFAFATKAHVRDAVSGVISSPATEKVNVYSVRNWGLGTNVTSQASFSNLVETLSYNQDAIVADWEYYATNKLAKEIVLAACHHGSPSLHLGVYSNMVSAVSLNNDAEYERQVFKYAFAPATPMENYMLLHYDESQISNLWMLAFTFFSGSSNTAERACYITNCVMNGRFKYEWEVEETAGLHK